jgi:hypothetical protein
LLQNHMIFLWIRHKFLAIKSSWTLRTTSKSRNMLVTESVRPVNRNAPVCIDLVMTGARWQCIVKGLYRSSRGNRAVFAALVKMHIRWTMVVHRTRRPWSNTSARTPCAQRSFSLKRHRKDNEPVFSFSWNLWRYPCRCSSLRMRIRLIGFSTAPVPG